MLVELSYPISPETTALDPGIQAPRVVPRSRVDEGKRSNTSYIELFAHAGTHIDAPWHFNSQGCQILDFAIEDFVFRRVLLVDIPKEAWQPVTREEVAGYKDELARCDALLIRSGFSRYRSTDPDLYVRATPGVSVEAAQFLAGLSGLRCVGVDFISIENVEKGRETGFPTHHVLLDRPEPILLLEDANLAILGDSKVSRLFLFPLRMSGLEASPVTAVAEV
jgi:kynurenine formamidase